MSIGMSYEEYWYGPNELCGFYYEAEKLRIEKSNQELWIQGLYNFKAVSVALYNGFKDKGKPSEKYPDKPFELFPHKEKKVDAQKEREKVVDYLEQLRLNYLKKHG